MTPTPFLVNYWGKSRSCKGFDIMARYYIDLENVHEAGFANLETLSESDTVIVFYSKSAPNLRINTVRRILASKVKFEWIYVHDYFVQAHQKNAMDFYLLTILLANYIPNEEMFIVSRDKGFDCTVQAAKSYCGIENIQRIVTIKSPAKTTDKQELEKIKALVLETASPLLPAEIQPEDFAAYLFEIIQNANEKVIAYSIYQKLVEKYKMKPILPVYNALKQNIDWAETHRLLAVERRNQQYDTQNTTEKSELPYPTPCRDESALPL